MAAIPGSFSWDISLIVFCFIAVICIYFWNNPLKHGRKFMVRRFINWFPLGMTYAFLYMARYNLTVSKTALGTLMSKEDFGLIFACGTWVYALSFLVNGPLVDKIGGKKGIIIAAIGASLANIALGVLTYLVATHQLQVRMVWVFALVYSVNMYFQSYGAISIIKVKAYWFHVRERGIFGAVFGTLISIGVYFAFDWGQAIVEMTKVNREGPSSLLGGILQGIFASKLHVVDATWAVFFIPAALLLGWAVLDWWLIRDTPEEANFPHFDTHDASSGQMDVELTTMDLLKKVFLNPLILMFAAVELTSGILRNGVMTWYLIFARETKQPGSEWFVAHWGLLVCIFGIIGGFAGGLISDRFFQSRRGPPAAMLCAFMFVMTVLMALALRSSPYLLGWAAVMISMAVIGVHSMMSGTAAADFGGRKATATCSGIVDGFAYLGTGIQAISLGYLTSYDWMWWPVFLMPFAVLGTFLAVRIWHDLPAATKKYIAQVETKSDTSPTPAVVDIGL